MKPVIDKVDDRLGQKRALYCCTMAGIKHKVHVRQRFPHPPRGHPRTGTELRLVVGTELRRRLGK